MTDEKLHLIEIYDAEGYVGPNPLRVTGSCRVRGPEGSKYYVVTPALEVVDDNGQVIRQMAVRPHYDGDSIDRATDSTCTVGIALAPPGKMFEDGNQYGFADFCFWRVGKIKVFNGSG